MSQPDPKDIQAFQELCEELMQHTRLMRDYASTPKNTWLARSELAKIAAAVSELEKLLDKTAD